MNSAPPVSRETRSETHTLNFLIDYALKHELPLALWRLPESAVKYLIISEQYHRLEKDATIEELPAGFIFAPFDPAKASLYLPGDHLFAFERGSLRDPESPAEAESAAWLNERQKDPAVTRRGGRYHTAPPDETAVDFLELVSKSIAEVEKGRFEKVVPSRQRFVSLPDDFDVLASFGKLCVSYRNALVSFVSIPGVGHWLGASPEPLVTVEDQKIFRTVALAGTMPYRDGMNLKAIAWTEKEIEEQALVERYVISCFKKIRLREYEEHGPRTMVAGNVVHLKSEFTVDMTATGFPQLGTIMLRLLHPTSAVCGMPLEDSLSFLKDNEGYDREFYAGYLGPVNIGSNISLFVNLRCMKLTDGKAVLYAGAGVTVDSVPENEWKETEMKFRTILNVVF